MGWMVQGLKKLTLIPFYQGELIFLQLRTETDGFLYKGRELPSGRLSFFISVFLFVFTFFFYLSLERSPQVSGPRPVGSPGRHGHVM